MKKIFKSSTMIVTLALLLGCGDEVKVMTTPPDYVLTLHSYFEVEFVDSKYMVSRMGHMSPVNCELIMEETVRTDVKRVWIEAQTLNCGDKSIAIEAAVIGPDRIIGLPLRLHDDNYPLVEEGTVMDMLVFETVKFGNVEIHYTTEL